MTHDNSFRSLTRYEDYYLSGGDLFFLVEHHVFRVHRYFFERESSYFKGKLATPASPGSSRQGTNETNAIVLDDVKVHEFARFLWVFYNPKYSLYHTSVADWVSILNLAHRWSFPEVKALAVRELEKQSMPDIDRVVVYQENDVDRNLLIPVYAALCERDAPLTPAEGHRLGIETALTIAHLREVSRRSPVDCRSPTPTNFRGNELFTLVRELFGIAPPPEDETALESPLGGPPPPLGLPSPATAPLAPQQQQPQPAAPLRPTKAPAQTGPPPRTVTPPPPAAPAQAPLTPPQAPPPVPPPKPELPPVQTGRMAQLRKGVDPSRPSTPAPETPVAGTTNSGQKQKKLKKGTKKQEEMVPTPSPVPRTDEETRRPVETEETVQQTQEGEKKDDGNKLDVEKKDENGVGSSQEGAGASSSVVPGVVSSCVGGVVKAGDGKEVPTVDGVSTDNTATTDAQGAPTKIEPTGMPSSTNPFNIMSPTAKSKGVVVNKNDLKSPLEKSKPTGFFDDLLHKGKLF